MCFILSRTHTLSQHSAVAHVVSCPSALCKNTRGSSSSPSTHFHTHPPTNLEPPPTHSHSHPHPPTHPPPTRTHLHRRYCVDPDHGQEHLDALLRYLRDAVAHAEASSVPLEQGRMRFFAHLIIFLRGVCGPLLENHHTLLIARSPLVCWSCDNRVIYMLVVFTLALAFTVGCGSRLGFFPAVSSPFREGHPWALTTNGWPAGTR